MSLPAHEVEHRTPSIADRPASPARTTAARPRTATPPQRHRRARRGLHPTFLIFATTIIVTLVVGVVAINALFAQTAFAIHETQAEVAALAERHAVLATESAALSSPGRIADWAERYHMVLPQNVVILRVSGRASARMP